MPRVISFSVQVIQSKAQDGTLTEIQKAAFGVQPVNDATGELVGRPYGIDLPNVAAAIQGYATKFGPAYAQQAAQDAATLEAILKRWGAVELAGLGMSGAVLPPL